MSDIDADIDTGMEPSEATVSGDTVEASPEPTEYDAPPVSWKREVADRYWSNLDPDLRSYVHARETESHSKITEQGKRLKELEATAQRVGGYEPLDNIFQRYQQFIPQGIERDLAIETLLQTHQLLQQPETRNQTISDLIEAIGINPLDLVPPQVREQFVTLQRDLHKTREAEVQKAVDDFTKDKAYYADIRDDVIKEILEIRKGAPGLDNVTVLKLAHDRVLERRDDVKGRIEAERSAKAMAEMAEKQKAERAEQDRIFKAAKRAAGVNVRSTPAVARPRRTMDDELQAIASRIYGT